MSDTEILKKLSILENKILDLELNNEAFLENQIHEYRDSIMLQDTKIEIDQKNIEKFREYRQKLRDNRLKDIEEQDEREKERKEMLAKLKLENENKRKSENEEEECPERVFKKEDVTVKIEVINENDSTVKI